MSDVVREGQTLIVGARTQYLVRVSDEDYDYLIQWPWTYAVSHPPYGDLVYARRSTRSSTGNGSRACSKGARWW